MMERGRCAGNIGENTPMAAETKIQWADATFNSWVGCTKVSSACDSCYAETRAKRSGSPELWTGTRRRTTPAYWKQPLKWNAESPAKHGRRTRVFCASLADVFDNQVPEEWRKDLWYLIGSTPNLIWMLLTKRPQNIVKMLPVGLRPPHTSGWPWPNVWLGTTVENQTEADRRIPHLLSVPAAVRFLSCEPLLSPVDLTAVPFLDGDRRHRRDALTGHASMYAEGIDGHLDFVVRINKPLPDRIDWVICGGESGPGARPMSEAWAASLRDQCRAADVPFFMKQMSGERGRPIKDIALFPRDLQIREWPHHV